MTSIGVAVSVAFSSIRGSRVVVVMRSHSGVEGRFELGTPASRTHRPLAGSDVPRPGIAYCRRPGVLAQRRLVGTPVFPKRSTEQAPPDASICPDRRFLRQNTAIGKNVAITQDFGASNTRSTQVVSTRDAMKSASRKILRCRGIVV